MRLGQKGMTRKFLRRVARALVGVMLFAQLAVAAYACPKLLPVAAAAQDLVVAPHIAVSGGQTRTTDCAGMDMTAEPDTGSSALCVEYCRSGQQSDQTAKVSVPIQPLTALYSMPRVPEFVAPSRQAAASPSALIAASPPPTIRHCRLLV